MNTIWDIVQQVLVSVLSISAVLGLVGWFGGRWIEAKFKARFDRALEDYRFELRSREQAAKIAEYSAIAWGLKATDSEELYRRANQLAWELFLWLPAETYKRLGRGLAAGSIERAEVLADVRKALLKERAGDLGPDHLIVHFPNVGAKL
jgi:hypothetical protein